MIHELGQAGLSAYRRKERPVMTAQGWRRRLYMTEHKRYKNKQTTTKHTQHYDSSRHLPGSAMGGTYLGRQRQRLPLMAVGLGMWLW